jgi:hypothetical protein
MTASALSPVFAATVFRPKQTVRPAEEQRAGQAQYQRATAAAPPQPPSAEGGTATAARATRPAAVLDLKT